MGFTHRRRGMLKVNRRNNYIKSKKVEWILLVSVVLKRGMDI